MIRWIRISITVATGLLHTFGIRKDGEGGETVFASRSLRRCEEAAGRRGNPARNQPYRVYPAHQLSQFNQPCSRHHHMVLQPCFPAVKKNGSFSELRRCEEVTGRRGNPAILAIGQLDCFMLTVFARMVAVRRGNHWFTVLSRLFHPDVQCPG